MTKLGIARVVGEVGLADKTMTEGICAAKYSQRLKKESDQATKVTGKKFNIGTIFIDLKRYGK